MKLTTIIATLVLLAVSFAGYAWAGVDIPWQGAFDQGAPSMAGIDPHNVEHVCSGDDECPSGKACFIGRCVADDICVDTDGGDDRSVKGWTRGGTSDCPLCGMGDVYDRCSDENTLMEYVCDAGGVFKYGVEHECENGCYDGRCLDVGESKPECRRMFPGHAAEGEDVINFVFVGLNQTDVQELLEIAGYLVDYDGNGTTYTYPDGSSGFSHGIFGVEPYKSNRSKFDIWYVDEILCPSNTCPSGEEHGVELLCGVDNPHIIEVVNSPVLGEKPSPTGAWGENSGFVKIRRGEADEYLAAGVLLHELGHGIGRLAHPFGDVVAYPNAASSVDEAKTWWGDMVGDGCGEDGVIDCLEDCYEKGLCGRDDYNVEVALMTDTPEQCFENGQAIYGCALDLTRVQLGGASRSYKHVAFRAMSKDACHNGSDNCMYDDVNEIMCLDKKLDRLDRCNDLGDYGKYQATGYYHEFAMGSVIRPHLFSLMKGPQVNRYGPVGEREICKRIAEITGGAGGYCDRFKPIKKLPSFLRRLTRKIPLTRIP